MALTILVSSNSLAERDSRVLDAARMYEKYFLGHMVQAMRGTVSYSDLQKPSMGEEIYRGQLDDSYVDSWTKTGGIGLADMIYDELMGKAEMAKRLKEEYRAARGKKRVPMTLTDRDVLQVRRLPQKEGTVLVSLARTQRALKQGREVVKTPWDAVIESIKPHKGPRDQTVSIGLRVATEKDEGTQVSALVELTFDGESARDIAVGDRVTKETIIGFLSPQAQGILVRENLTEHDLGPAKIKREL